MALAHTLKRGEHIRVTLLIGALKGSMRRALEMWSLVLASALAWLFAFYSCRLAWQSKMFNDISTGNDATPLWIPQLGMALGTVIFAIAFLDEAVLQWRGRRAPAESDELVRSE
jgi:TRAP-type C4-dicarboxylate transport system permease small subunit